MPLPLIARSMSNKTSMRRTTFDRDRRERDRFLARSLPPGVLLQIGHGEERAPGVDPAPRFQDRDRDFGSGKVELAITIEGVGLEETGISGQMALRMLALAVARVIKHRRRRRCSAKRPVVANIDPASPRIGLALGQNRDRRVITVQALSRHDMGLDESQQRIERRAARPHGVGHGRQADRHTFPSIALGLPVQGLMLAELLEQRSSPADWRPPIPWRSHGRGRRLADLLAIPAGELLPHRFDHLPLARDRLQGPGHVLAELAQPCSAATVTSRRWIDHHALAEEDARGRCCVRARLRAEACHIRGLGDTAISAASSSSVTLASSSSSCSAN